MDIITYAGEINIIGYRSICEALKTKKSDTALLVLCTPGGDPHAGFRIARALQHCYSSFDALIPGSCKSAGTLVVIGARHLFLDDMSELGPLDVQVKKNDEVFGRNSGLDILQAVTYLQSQAMNAFRAYLVELTRDAGLSTKVASDISSKLTTGLYEPVFAQIDPMRLAEMQRAMEIAFAYGQRLDAKSGNLKSNGLAQLATGYPSHGFVIDRKEARTLFNTVLKPEGLYQQISEGIGTQMLVNTNAAVPIVNIYCPPDSPKGDEDARPPNSESSSSCNSAGHAQVGGNGKVDPAAGSISAIAAAEVSIPSKPRRAAKKTV